MREGSGVQVFLSSFLFPPSALSLWCLEDRALCSCSLCSPAFLSRLFSFIFSWTFFPSSHFLHQYTFFTGTSSQLKMNIHTCAHMHAQGANIHLILCLCLRKSSWPAYQTVKATCETQSQHQQGTDYNLWDGLSSQRQEHVFSWVTLVRSLHALHYVYDRVFFRATFASCCSHRETRSLYSYTWLLRKASHIRYMCLYATCTCNIIYTPTASNWHIVLIVMIEWHSQYTTYSLPYVPCAMVKNNSHNFQELIVTPSYFFLSCLPSVIFNLKKKVTDHHIWNYHVFVSFKCLVDYSIQCNFKFSMELHLSVYDCINVQHGSLLLVAAVANEVPFSTRFSGGEQLTALSQYPPSFQSFISLWF